MKYIIILALVVIGCGHKQAKQSDYSEFNNDSVYTFSEGDSIAHWYKLPHMTSKQMDSIKNPEEGTMIWNTDYKLQCFFDGKSWQVVSGELEDINDN